MTASYLFHSEGLVKLARYVAPNTLFAFDLDGTLAPIVADFASAQVTEPIRDAMKRLAKVAKIAVITGRSRKDALRMLEFEPLVLTGNHGAEWPSEGNNRKWNQIRLCLKWQGQLYEELGYVNGIEIEFKGESLAIHYRKAADPDQAFSIINSAIEKLEPPPQRFAGKFVINILPPEALTKGDALVAIMNQFGLERAIYFGDDITDEEVFRLKDVDVFGIHIGTDGQTAALYYLNNQSDMLGLLNSMVGILETHKKAEQNE